MKHVYSHQVGPTASQPTHHDPSIVAPAACIWAEASDIAVGGESVFDSSLDSLDSMGREYLSTNLSTKAHFLHQLKRDKTLLIEIRVYSRVPLWQLSSMSKKSLLHSIKMHDATDLMPRLMSIHSTADMYAAHRRCIRSFIKTQGESKATADRKFEHSTEGEHQSQEASEVQSMHTADRTQTSGRAPTPVHSWVNYCF